MFRSHSVAKCRNDPTPASDHGIVRSDPITCTNALATAVTEALTAPDQHPIRRNAVTGERITPLAYARTSNSPGAST